MAAAILFAIPMGLFVIGALVTAVSDNEAHWKEGMV